MDGETRVGIHTKVIDQHMRTSIRKDVVTPSRLMARNATCRNRGMLTHTGIHFTHIEEVTILKGMGKSSRPFE